MDSYLTLLSECLPWKYVGSSAYSVRRGPRCCSDKGKHTHLVIFASVARCCSKECSARVSAFRDGYLKVDCVQSTGESAEQNLLCICMLTRSSELSLPIVPKAPTRTPSRHIRFVYDYAFSKRTNSDETFRPSIMYVDSAAYIRDNDTPAYNPFLTLPSLRAVAGANQPMHTLSGRKLLLFTESYRRHQAFRARQAR